MEKSDNGEERVFHQIIREICEEKEIGFEKLSYDWIIQLKKDNLVRHITGNRFDINSESCGRIAGDKYATYEVLKSNNVPIIEHQMVFNPITRGEYLNGQGIWEKVIKFFYDNNCKIVVKPNQGCEGVGIYLCNTIAEVEYAITKLLKNNGSLSICPYYEIDTEYRTIYLDGNCELIYGKTKPYVVGNGVDSIEILINEQLQNFPHNFIVEQNMCEIDLNFVPQKDEKFYLSWKHNLSGGALPTILEDEELKSKISRIAKKAAEAMNIQIASIDIIKTEDNKLYVMEINSGICMRHFIENTDGGYDIAKRIYAKAVDNMFRKK